MLADAQPVKKKRKRFVGLFFPRVFVFLTAAVSGSAVLAETEKNLQVNQASQGREQQAQEQRSQEQQSIPSPVPSLAENIDLKEVVIQPLGEEELPEVPAKQAESGEAKSVAKPENAGEATGSLKEQATATPEQEKETAVADSVSGEAEAESKTPLTSLLTTVTEPEKPAKLPLVLLDAEVPPGTSTRLAWTPKMSFMGIAAPTAVLVINGVKDGPTLCLTGAVHGDELNGIEIIRHVVYNIDPRELSGAVIGVPIVNLQGFRRSSRYLPDRRDLNRYFPGNPDGSSASRIAHSFFEEVVSHCDMLVDIHTGSFHRTNLPQVRADLAYPNVKELAKGMGAIVVVQSKGHPGSLRRAAVEAGITAITLEAGQPHELQKSAVNHGTKSLENLMDSLGMLKRRSFWEIKAEPIYYSSRWVRATQGGILFSNVELGDRVKEGDLLGTVTDPITNMRANITAPADGRVIGMALNQVMYPGFAAYHIGLQATAEEAVEKATELEAGDLLDAGVDGDDPDEVIDVPAGAVGANTPPPKKKEPDGKAANAAPEPLDRFGVLEDSE